MDVCDGKPVLDIRYVQLQLKGKMQMETGSTRVTGGDSYKSGSIESGYCDS